MHVEPNEPDAGSDIYTFLQLGNKQHKDWDNTVIGRAVLSAGELALESNSVRRADGLRKRVEKACKDLIRHRAREHSDPTSPAARAKAAAAPRSSGLPPEEEARLIREYKEQHYASWVDQPLPALGGKTPRAAVRTKAGRERVDVLLKEVENRESQLPAGQRFDFSRIRRELSLEP